MNDFMAHPTIAPSEIARTATSHPHLTYLAQRHFGSLDGVRALSILAVIWHHCPAKFQANFALAVRGFLGVDMFFVLSGFLIVTLLLRERERTGTIDLSKFYVRRSLRIFPIYYLLLLVVAAALLVFRSRSRTLGVFLADLPYLITYTSNWVVITAPNLRLTWSLATEEQFYLVWPSVEKYLKPPVVLLTLAAVVIVNQMINFHLLDPWIARAYGGRLPSLAILEATFTPIALGAILAHTLHHRATFAALYRVIGSRWAPVALVAALLFLCEILPSDLRGWPRLSIQLLMTAWLASLVIREDHLARPLLKFGPLARLGVLSYGMYLYHEWVMHPIHLGFHALKMPEGVGFFVAAVLGTTIVSELSFRIVEQPMLRVKQRFATP